jgi:transketolase
VVAPFTHVLASGGDLREEVSAAASSLAGHQGVEDDEMNLLCL